MTKRTSTQSGPQVDRAVEPTVATRLLERQISKAEELLQKKPLRTSDHEAWNNTTRDYLIKAFGSGSPNIEAVIHAESDHDFYFNMPEGLFQVYEESRLSNQIKMLRSCIEQLQTEIDIAVVTPSPLARPTPKRASKRVFVVHGRDTAIKETVARLLERLGLDPVILHEKPNQGQTIIEKFSHYSDVHFAVVLMTGDDEGREKGTSSMLTPRTRQNVLLELGFFLGRLGRSKVCALYEDGVEIPSDYQGVIFLPLDPQEKWRFDLVKELKAAGFSIDANTIFTSD